MFIRIFLNIFSFIWILYIISYYLGYIDIYYLYIINSNENVLIFLLLLFFIIGIIVSDVSYFRNKHYNFSIKEREKYLFDLKGKLKKKNFLLRVKLKVIILLLTTFFLLMLTYITIVVINRVFVDNWVYKMVSIFFLFVMLSNIIAKIYVKIYDK